MRRASGRAVRPGALVVRTYLFVGFVWVLAIVFTTVAWRLGGPPSNLPALVVLVALAVASWLGRDNDVGGRVQLSFISIVVLAAIVITGPAGAAIVGAAACALQPRPMPWRVRAFNTAMFACIGAVGGMVYVAVGGSLEVTELHGAGSLLFSVGLPLMIADVCQCLTNAVLLAAIQQVANAVPMRAQVWSLLATTGPAYIGYGVIGFLFVVLWIPARVGWFSTVLVLAPLFVARWAFVQYGDELQAHERTLRALVTAVETKEPHNAGHSERVAQLCEWLAETLGLGHKEIQDVRTAGMLHDIGKVGVPTRLLRARRPLTDDEVVVLADHARGGVDLVEGIDFLAGSVQGIAHHHERFDGRGYPAGLAGEAIPISARIIAVADVFDALTTSRSYRSARTVEGALADLGERSGTQFDPHVVEALGRVLGRHEWHLTERTDEELLPAAAAIDHDDPEVSDLLASRPDLRARLRGSPPLLAQSPARTRG